MKTFKQFIKEAKGVPSDYFDDIIASMIDKPGYQGHEIMGDTISFQFDSDDNADMAYTSLDAEELVHLDNPFEDGFDEEDLLYGEDDDDEEDDEELDESITESVTVNEARIIIKVNSQGKRRKRVKCKRGFKLNPKGTACVPIAGREKAKKKVAIRKSVKTKKSKGSGYKNRSTRRRKKAMRKRKAMGL